MGGTMRMLNPPSTPRHALYAGCGTVMCLWLLRRRQRRRQVARLGVHQQPPDSPEQEAACITLKQQQRQSWVKISDGVYSCIHCGKGGFGKPYSVNQHCNKQGQGGDTACQRVQRGKADAAANGADTTNTLLDKLRAPARRFLTLVCEIKAPKTLQARTSAGRCSGARAHSEFGLAWALQRAQLGYDGERAFGKTLWNQVGQAPLVARRSPLAARRSPLLGAH